MHPADNPNAGASALIETAAATLERLRETRPRVHCITNSVVMNFTANVLLAIGAVPSMTVDPDEIPAFVPGAGGLLINLGTMDGQRREAVSRALEVAAREGVPWVLDPVFADLSPHRAAFSRALIGQAPAVVRGNERELSVLAAAGDEMALDAFAAVHHTVAAATGPIDEITDGQRVIRLSNGHPLMDRVTGMGCAASALIAAFLAVAPSPTDAAVVALATIEIAGEQAGDAATGPGSFATALLDALYGIDGEAIQRRARVTVEDASAP